MLVDHPLREGLWLQLMRALDAAGRHAEALEVYGQARNAISDQLGVDPGTELRQLYADLLAKDQTGLRGTISAGTVAAHPRKPAAGKSRGSAPPDAAAAGLPASPGVRGSPAAQPGPGAASGRHHRFHRP